MLRQTVHRRTLNKSRVRKYYEIFYQTLWHAKTSTVAPMFKSKLGKYTVWSVVNHTKITVLPFFQFNSYSKSMINK